jgi:hypothetical protein
MKHDEISGVTRNSRMPGQSLVFKKNVSVIGQKNDKYQIIFFLAPGHCLPLVTPIDEMNDNFEVTHNIAMYSLI